jgi:hypothetical protein
MADISVFRVMLKMLPMLPSQSNKNKEGEVSTRGEKM